MTRFARAKGSKASNQRLPEEATSWQEMKQGMLHTNNKRVETIEDESKSSERSTNNNSTETFSISSFKKKDKGPAKWSEFSELNQPNLKHQNSKSTGNQERIVSDSKVSGKKKRKHKVSEETSSEKTQNETNAVSNDAEEDANNSLVKKKKKKPKMHSSNVEESHNEENGLETANKKMNKKRKRTTSNANESEERNPDLLIDKKNKGKKFHNNEEVQDNSTATSTSRDSYKNDRNFANKNKQFNNNNKQHKHFSEPNKQSFMKNKFEGEYKRRKPNSQVERVFINGNFVEISYYDGFPVKKEDADRLKDLKKQMVSRGVPKSEIAKAMKLERRKAEKALTREKKKVCFNCRMSGHTLSECPSLNSGSGAQLTETGICFKCGSTEHTHFECKVTRGDNFKFAQCFICKEQGHIARQCPDNSRGLYPKGGACRVCGDVTHLKKDCPKYQSEQEEQKIVAHTIDDQNIESLENETVKINKKSKSSQKIIKF